MVTQAPKRLAVLAMIAFTLSCIGLMIFVWVQFRGTIPYAAQGYRVNALFTETGLLVPNADVRISGVNIGTVTSVQTKGVNSLVTLDIDHEYAPIPADTRAILRQKTLLGEAYIELSTGDRTGPKLRDDGAIPSSQIQPAQQLDQVLNSFNAQTQRNLQALLVGTYTALYGRSQNLNDAVGNLDPAVTDAASIAGGLDHERASVRRLISDTGTVLSTVGDRSSDLQHLITAGDQVLSATAARNAQLTATVNALPPFLTQLHATLGTLDTTLGIAKPTVAALVPVGPLLTPALSDLVELSGPAIRLLRQAPGLLDAADTALPSITDFVDAFRPAVKAVLPAAENIVPMIEFISKYSRELTSSMANVAAFTEATAPADTTAAVGGTPAGSAHYARVLPPLNNEMFFGQSVREPTNRHNAYIAPGGWSSWATGLPSSDCNNVHDTAQIPVLNGSGNVPCITSKGWTFNGLTQYYPHLTRKPAPK
jgi:phospholipid/cholesterol/gamma-HCH transport system substrate-binding protein